MTKCRDCDVEAETVFGDLICPDCGTVFECEFDQPGCLGPDADELTCFPCTVGRIPIGFQE